MSELNHECGIAALYHLKTATPSDVPSAPDPNQISRLMPRMLLDLQNRDTGGGHHDFRPGSTPNPQHLQKAGNRDRGVSTQSSRQARKHHAAACRHGCHRPRPVRDLRGRGRQLCPAVERHHGCKWKWFAIALNGQLANFAELRTQLLELTDYHLTRETDTEVIMHSLAHVLRGDERIDLVDAFSELCSRFDGAFNIVFLNAMGEMAIVRDPHGFRPLCYAQDGGLFAAASESVPLLNLGFRDIRSMEPGEIIVIRDNKVEHGRIAPLARRSHCFFEWIYFANVASTLDDHSVYLARSALGKELAREERRMERVPLDGDTVVVPVPDTGKAAADAMAHELGLPSVEGLMRNRYLGRTFIEGENRGDRARLKYTPLREVLEGKRVLLVEDTIVRSTTMKSLLREIRERGAPGKSTCASPARRSSPPAFTASTCRRFGSCSRRVYERSETCRERPRAHGGGFGRGHVKLFAPGSGGACIGLDDSKLCRGCLTGSYPTPAGEKLYQVVLWNTHDTSNGRTYEIAAGPSAKRPIAKGRRERCSFRRTRRRIHPGGGLGATGGARKVW